MTVQKISHSQSLWMGKISHFFVLICGCRGPNRVACMKIPKVWLMKNARVVNDQKQDAEGKPSEVSLGQ